MTAEDNLNSENFTTFSHLTLLNRTDTTALLQSSALERLRKMNTGFYHDNGSMVDQEKMRDFDNTQLFKTIASQLELTKFQKERGEYLFKRLNFNDISRPVELVAFAVCIIVCNEDGHNHPTGELRVDRSDATHIEIFRREQDYKPGHIVRALNAVQEAL